MRARALHSDHARLAKRVHSAVYETCREYSLLDDGLLSAAAFALRDLRWSVYRGTESVDRHLRDELRELYSRR